MKALGKLYSNMLIKCTIIQKSDFRVVFHAKVQLPMSFGIEMLPYGAAGCADLGGSSKYSNENFEG